ncbi:restriction endonuclease subunit S [Peptoniphilus sp. BV3AC2]|nr:restriction endonuclease subunit S [Peptoniphilus sp. BV3AC2]
MSKEIISNQTIPLPLLAEQKRIVDRLEELLPLCDKLIKNKEK